MQNERGAAGIIAILVAIVAILGLGGYFILKNKTASHPAFSGAGSTTADTDSAPDATPARHAPDIFLGIPISDITPLSALIPIDSKLSKNSSGAYLKKKSDAAGVATQYVKFSVPDPQALSRVYPSLTWRKPMPGASGAPAYNSAATPAQVSYYKDQHHVYVLQESIASDASGSSDSLAILAGADPATFQLLGDQYARDAEHVYVITTTCNEGVCMQSLVVIPEADLPSFQEFAESLVEQKSGATIVADAADVNNLYYGGTVVGAASAEALSNKKIYGTPEPNGLIWIAP